MLKIPSPLNLFDNKSGQLGGDGLQDWLYKCNQHTLQTFRVRHLYTKDLNVKSFSFISVWINWLCLKILIANFSQTIVLGGLLDMSLWRPATVCLPDEFNEVCLCGGRWPSKMTMPDKKKKSLSALKQNNSKCRPRGPAADDRVDVQLPDFQLIWGDISQRRRASVHTTRHKQRQIAAVSLLSTMHSLLWVCKAHK